MRIEMRLTCNLVIGYLQLVIGNRQETFGYWQQAMEICNGNWKLDRQK